MYQHLYRRFLGANPGVQHFACHSHHYWPDVTREAQLAYWDDSARLVDDKWQYLFGEKIPSAQRLIADVLQLPSPAQIVFAPNTHEFVMRLFSCFDARQRLRVLSTDSEFHSFARQSKRLAQSHDMELVTVPTEPYDDFEARFIAAAAAQPYDLIFCSQVFFNSGIALRSLPEFVKRLAAVSDAQIAIDGYHGFMALPTDLSDLASRIFYIAGSYKYAQGGEGCCFMVVPQICSLRPAYTGWFAEFGSLSDVKPEHVAYASDGLRFAGATMDFSALYRLEAALSLFQREGLSVPVIHGYVQQLQQAFLAKLDALNHPQLNRRTLLLPFPEQHGHFLTFKLDSPEAVAALSARLKAAGIQTDHRGDRLRFGFALYQSAHDFDLSCLRS